jgi:surface protein
MFYAATSFNQPIGNWNIANVIDIFGMFQNATAFNQDIGSWNTGSVTGFNSMFRSATSFSQNLSSWPLRLAGVSATSIFQNSGMSTANYTDTIVGWANYVNNNSNTPVNVGMVTQTGRTFQNSRSGGAGFATAQDARTFLTTGPPTGPGWTISGDTIIA